MTPGSTATPELEIRLLGDVMLLRGGEVQTLPASKKTRALLGYLIAKGRPESRARICELLWDGPDDPRGGLRWSLSKLRTLLDGEDLERLKANREQVELGLDDVDIDLLAVRKLVVRGIAKVPEEDLVRAIARFRGRFLEGLDLPNCVHFYAWCIAEREEVRALEVKLLTELIGRLASRPDEALRYARALVALDPLAEASHLRLIRLLADAGRTRDALTECDRCRRILSNEIGARPSAELEKLRYTLAQRSSAPPAPTPPPSAYPPNAPSAPHEQTEAISPKAEPPGSRRFPLVGRGAARSGIDRLVQSAAEPGAPALLFFGEAGVGKSRLLEELADTVRASGGRVVSGRAFEAEVVRPYGPFIDALGSAAFELPAEPQPNVEARDRPLLFEGARRHIERMAEGTPLLGVLIDDVQWLDESSAALLHYLVRELQARRVVVALAARPGELEDSPAAYRTLRALEREQRLTRVAVEPLDEAATRALVEAAAPGADAARIYRESGGNPLFALELARALAAGDDDLPAGIVTLIQERLARLDDDARGVLAWCAALGHAFEPELVLRLSGIPSTTLLGALEVLERHGVLATAGAGGYDFAHDLVRRAAYGSMSEPRRRLVHAHIARALEREADPNGVLAGDLLHHAALAGDHELAARACIAAGLRCIRLFAYGDARDLARRGLEHAEHLPPAARVELKVELLALALQRSLKNDESVALEAELANVILEASRHDLDTVVVRAFNLRAQLRYGVEDQVGAGDNSLLALESGSTRGPDGAVKVLGAARCLAHLERDFDKVEALVVEATRLLGAGSKELDYVWTRALVLRFHGDHAAAARDLERVLAEHRRRGLHWQECWALRDLVLNELERGDPARALAYLPVLGEVSEKMGEGSERPLVLALTAIARLSLGQSAAWPELEAALVALRRADGKGTLAMCENFAAELALAAKLPRDAQKHAESALGAASAVRYESQMTLARALLSQSHSAAGNRDDARNALGTLEPRTSSRRTWSARAELALERARAALDVPRPKTPAASARRAQQ
ncbi:MAG TPA: AAA family ATPase [Polyangiaceae bacterium]|nr:AAA family ATPase [Polyangiaceae bacterium]